MTTDIAAIRALLAAKPRPVGWAARRARIEEVGAHWPTAPDVVCTPVDAGGVPAEWSVAPGSDPGRVLLFFHGGGFCSGSLVSHRRLVTEAGRAGGMRTLAIAYRLAPEHPYPAALDDAVAAWRFLRQASIAADAIAVGGDSAGANLAVSLVKRLKAQGEPGPGCAWLISPWVDLSQSGATLATKDAEDPLIHKGYLDELAQAYAGPGLARTDPRVSPLFADLAGLPPTLIQVGSAETLLDDAVRFAGRAGAAAVRVRLDVWPEMIHAFPLWNGGLAEGRRALAEAGAFMRTHLSMLNHPAASGHRA
jgi:epsilon-lactone hydrolase